MTASDAKSCCVSRIIKHSNTCNSENTSCHVQVALPPYLYTFMFRLPRSLFCSIRFMLFSKAVFLPDKHNLLFSIPFPWCSTSLYVPFPTLELILNLFLFSFCRVFCLFIREVTKIELYSTISLSTFLISAQLLLFITAAPWRVVIGGQWADQKIA